jgi:hypothetical protein
MSRNSKKVLQQPDLPNQGIKRALKLTDQLLSVTGLIQKLETELEMAKELQQQLEQVDIPELMAELELSAFVLKDGRKVEVKPDFKCGITQERKPQAIAWLDENGFGGIIKTKLQTYFHRSDREAALELMSYLEAKAKQRHVDVQPEVEEIIHSSTLKSFLKEEMSKGTAVPFDLFGIFPYNKVIITK